MIIADTSGLLALFNRGEPAHTAVAALVAASSDPLVISPYVIAELDYLVATRMGVSTEMTILREISGGAYDIATVDADDIAVCCDVIDKYRDQQIGIADASIMVLARRYSTKQVLTLDRRHFTVLRPLDGGRFKLTPD
jgi:uncharacterized protein